MKRYKTYIFDLDDTLLETHSHVLKVIYPKLANHLGIEYLGFEIASKHWGEEFDVCLPKIFKGDFSLETAISKLIELHHEFPVPPTANALKVIDTIKKYKKAICIITSGHPDLVKIGIEKGLGKKMDFFDYVYITQNEVDKKPSSKILDKILNEIQGKKIFDLNKEDIVFIGDSLLDLETAKISEIDFFGVTTGVVDRQAFVNAGLNDTDICQNLLDIFSSLREHGIVALIVNSERNFLMVQEGRTNNQFYGAWSGPHGRCMPEDILEEESVVRETQEEVGLKVMPLRELGKQPADSKVKTVSFWLAKPLESLETVRINAPEEINGIKWVSIEEVLADKIKLYPGTKKFFMDTLLNLATPDFEKLIHG